MGDEGGTARLYRNGSSSSLVPRFSSLWTALLALSTAAPLGAQIVRGAVTEKGTGLPLSGVVLTVVDEQGKTVVEALSGEQGAFEIRVPGTGRFALDAKRIGVRRVRLEPFTIGDGETYRADVVLEPIPTVLASLKVTARTPCVRRPQENAKVAALWEDARAALAATVITRLRASPTGKVVRFTRKLDVRNWRVLFEQRRELPASADRPFRSLPADDLSERGYVRENRDGSVDYYAPDAEVLLSDQFLADHCFRVEAGTGWRAKDVGLGFEPIPKRKTPDVRGVLWLDGRTSELRTLEFTYTWLPFDERPGDFGGTVDFFRMLSGQWIVRNWRIRTPEFGHEQWIEKANGDRVPLAPSRTPHVVRITEEGGAVPLGVLFAVTGIRGTVVFDRQSGRALEGITVALGGTRDSAVTDASGRFRLSGVDAGSYTVVLRHPVLDSLGIEHLAATVDVRPAATAELALEFPTSAELSARQCNGAVDLARNAIVRVIAVDEATGTPLRDVPVVLRAVRSDAEPAVGATGHRGTLDIAGSFVACGIPGGEPVRIQLGPDSAVRWTGEARAAAGVVGWQLIRVPAARPGERR